MTLTSPTIWPKANITTAGMDSPIADKKYMIGLNVPKGNESEGTRAATIPKNNNQISAK